MLRTPLPKACRFLSLKKKNYLCTYLLFFGFFAARGLSVVRASHCSGFSCQGAWKLECGLGRYGTQA